MKKILPIIMSLLCVTLSILPNLFVNASELASWDQIPERDPITSIDAGQYGIVQYNYQDGNRVNKQGESFTVTYQYDRAGNLLSENGINGNIDYIIETVQGEERCVGFKYDNEIYYYIFDELGSVTEIVDKNREIVCTYEYEFPKQTVFQIVDGVAVACNEEKFVGNVNPIRYQGWYYDFETGYYYTGDGIFYDVLNNNFIMNDIELGSQYSRSADISAPMALYVSCMNSTSFNSGKSQVTEAEWNTGKRWFDGLSDTEVCARCIIGENSYSNKDADRTAVAYVIANRINERYQGTTLWTVVTGTGKFSSINPLNFGAGSAAAMATWSPSDARWQQAVKLACILTYTTDHSLIGSVYAAPAGISSQLSFYQTASVVTNTNFTVSGGKMYYKGYELERVAIAGVGELTIPNGTDKSFLNNYPQTNLFYKIIE